MGAGGKTRTMPAFWSVDIGDLVSVVAVVSTIVSAYARLADRLTRVEVMVQILMTDHREKDGGE